MQGFRNTLALTRHIGLLALVLWVPTAAAADYSVTVSRDAQNHYVGKYSWQGVIKTNLCYVYATYDQATLRLTTSSTGSLIFSSGQQCPVVNVFDPADYQTGTYSISVNSEGDNYYELTNGSFLIKTYGFTFVTNAAATLTLTSPVYGGAVYGGTLKIGNSSPQTVTNLYVTRQGSVPAPTAPNLTISAFSATPTAVNVGGTSTLAATVRNVGDSSSGATTLRYYYWTGSVWSEIATCANNVGSLTPGATSIQSCIITVSSTAGEYLFGVHVDTVPGESNTADNDSAQIKVMVGAAPTAPTAPTYVLTVATAGGGTVTGTGISCGGDCGESYLSGTGVTLTATSLSGSTFSGWGGDCSGFGTASTCTLTMNAAKSVTASFTPSSPQPPPGQGTASVDLNQHGLTGSWYDPATSGQGIEVEVFANPSGTGSSFVSWFTYDSVIGGAERQRWYTLQGPVITGQSSASLTIYQNTGGNFNAPPATNAHAVGTATLSFDTCSSGHLSYTFTDGTGRADTIPLTRLLPNVTCSVTTPHPTNADFALSGNWYAPATSGQGMTVEVNPSSGAFFAAWYTYIPNGNAAGLGGQRWYTAQGALTPGLRTIPVQIYQTTGGKFDTSTPPGQGTVQVGSGTMTFQSCSAATFSYTFTGGSSIGSSGTINLGRVGPVPPGCTQ